MKRKQIIILVSVAAAILLIWLLFFRKKEETFILETEKPQTGYISESVTATGKVQPVDTVTVGTQVSGTLTKLYADFNSTVKKGQLLAELDKTLLQATVDQSKASLVQAQSNLTYQEGNFDRQKQLYATGSISKAEYEQALNTYNAAKATVNSVQAQLRSAQRNLSFTEIYSPIDGVVLNRHISVGQTVAASFSTPTLFVIAKDITKMQVQAFVDEADIGNVKLGQRATFTVDAFIDDVFKGTVKEIRLQPSSSSNVVTYTTLIDAPNDDKKLMPGMTANITIFTKEVENALLVSASAVKFKPDSSMAGQYDIVPDPALRKSRSGGKSQRPGGSSAGRGGPSVSKDAGVNTSYVWVLQDDKKLVQKKIKTGLNDNTHVQVLEGLSVNDIVVTAASMGDGTVQVQRPAASPFTPARGRGGNRGGGR
ncbi:MAG TPA: efflux RND transporter periplasmic adaptor subunit [Sphingobacteriaceae bacterium]|nr:efflux RND transporter periplasmic adaptor subunit [Sphingobacteriaceae bacterium]